ncbi:MAG TPA: M56 family metallopeptidase [Vicinamibacterales bacterium]
MSAFLLEAVLKASVLVLAGLLAASLPRARSAAFRHWILAAATLCAWATLPLSLVMPAPLRTTVGSQYVTASTDVAATAPAVEVNISDTVVAGAPVRDAARARPWPVNAARLLAWVWAVGALSSGVMLLIGFARLRYVASRATEVRGDVWTRTRDELQQAFELSCSVRLLQSDHASLLVTWGWQRPTIVLPAPATAWSEERVRLVLAHEFAHIARSDWIVQVSAEALRAICWFNPLMWLACRRLRDESERACDDVVLMLGVPAASYAGHLVDLVRRLHPVHRPSLPALTMARPSGLEGRIVAMLNSSMNRRPLSRQARIVSTSMLLALALSVAALQAQQAFYSFGGTVRDPSDRVLADTTLLLVNPETSAKYEIKSDAAGRFQFVGLPPASYKLVVSRMGFANVSETLSLSGNITRDIRLKVGELQETITVTDRSVAPSPADPAVQQRRAASMRKFEELSARAKAQCAAGADAVVGGSILPPAKLVDVRPVYPDHLKAAKVGGIVTMDAVIGTDGLVKDIDNLHGPDPALEQAAADAVRQWQFSATLLNCQAIDVNMHVTTNFKVEP